MNVEYGREPQGTGLPAILLCCLLSSVVAAGGVFVALGGNAADSGRSPGFRPTLRSLEQLANLVALRVRLADTLTVDARDGVDSVRAAWIVRGDALVGVDVAAAVIESIDAEARLATVSLPEPRAISPRIDHLGTSVFDMRTGMLTGDRYVAGIQDRAMRLAQERIERQAAEPEHLELARERIESIVRGFYALAGWTVEIRWRDRGLQ